jgi:hypothetical protein
MPKRPKPKRKLSKQALADAKMRDMRKLLKNAQWAVTEVAKYLGASVATMKSQPNVLLVAHPDHIPLRVDLKTGSCERVEPEQTADEPADDTAQQAAQ